MPTETRMVHFTLGENAGALLASIAQEHLIYGHNPTKAVETITKSLIDVPMDIAMKILKGDLVLFVDEGNFLAAPYDPALHSKIFTHLDCAKFAVKKAKEIREAGLGLAATISSTRNKMRYRDGVVVTFPYEHILDFIGGDTAGVLRDLIETREVEVLEGLIRVSKAFIETATQDLAIIHFMKKAWPEDFVDLDQDIDYKVSMDVARDELRKVMEALSDLLNSSLVAQDKVHYDPSVEKFIDNMIEIEKTIKKGLEPVNIMDNYSAGWLAPDGTYYALNGEIANMLHNQIADALVEKGLIPDTEENRQNPDNWLHGQGWVKVHGNQIFFEGNLNEWAHRGINCYMTNKQIDLITEYCRFHHREIVKCTFQPISALQFQALAKSPSKRKEFYREYFMGDLGE